MILNDQQKAVFHEVLEWFDSKKFPIAILKGEAGTGKTTLARFVAENVVKRRKTVRILAPTGRAARIISKKTGFPASTIHSEIYELDKVEVNENIGTQSEIRLGDHRITFRNKTPPPEQPNLYIIDESSMVYDESPDTGQLKFGQGRLLHDLLYYSEIIQRSNPKARVLFIGDDAQLPPIYSIDSPALSARYILENFKIPCREFELSNVMRHEDGGAIIENARRIRLQITQEKFDEFRIELDEDSTKNTNAVVAVKDFANASDQSKHVLITATNSAALTYNRAIRKLIFDNEQPVTVGDVLLVTRNSMNGFMNGDLLKVVHVSPDNEVRNIRLRGIEKTISLAFRDIRVRPIEYDDSDKDQDCKIIENLLDKTAPYLSYVESHALLVDFIKRRPELRINTDEFTRALVRDVYYNALLVKFGYAITCHKAQGGEWDTVYVSFDRVKRDASFFKWAYTAITRAQKRLQVIDPPNFGVCIGNRPVPEKTTQDLLWDTLKESVGDPELLERFKEFIFSQHDESSCDSEAMSPCPSQLSISQEGAELFCEEKVGIDPDETSGAYPADKYSERRPAEGVSRAGKPWSLEEDHKVISEYKSNLSIDLIAKEHRRTKGAIISRLGRLGLMELDLDRKAKDM